MTGAMQKEQIMFEANELPLSSIDPYQLPQYKTARN